MYYITSPESNFAQTITAHFIDMDFDKACNILQWYTLEENCKSAYLRKINRYILLVFVGLAYRPKDQYGVITYQLPLNWYDLLHYYLNEFQNKHKDTAQIGNEKPSFKIYHDVDPIETYDEMIFRNQTKQMRNWIAKNLGIQFEMEHIPKERYTEENPCETCRCYDCDIDCNGGSDCPYNDEDDEDFD